MPRAYNDREREQIRTDLIEAAKRAALSGGFRKVSVQRLTQEIGISKGGFYNFFPSKEALFLEMLQEAEAQMRARLEAAAEANGEAEHVVGNVVGIIVNAFESHPMLGLLRRPEELAWLARALPEGTLEAARADDDNYFKALLQRLIDRRLVTPNHPPTILAELARASLASASQAHLLGESAEFRAFLSNALTRALLRP